MEVNIQKQLGELGGVIDTGPHLLSGLTHLLAIVGSEEILKKDPNSDSM